MRTNGVKMAAMCLLLSGVAAKGQTNVSTDGGTTYRIPKFSGTGTITNSVITEQNGRVGIGTATPAAAFDLPRFTGGGPLMTLGASRFLNYVPLDIHIDGNPGPTGANGMWISSGTDFNSASAFALYVYPNDAAATNATLTNDPSGNAGLTVFEGGGRSKGFVFNPNTTNGYMDFRVGTGGSTTSALRIAGNGNVGIGTTSPGAKLEVNGAVKLSGSNGSITFPDNSVQTKALPDNALLITSNSSDSYVTFENKGPGGRTYAWDVGSVGAGIGAGNFAIYDVTGGTARFVVTPVGYIGINTTNPQYQLDVNGNIKIEGNSALYFPDGSHLSSATGLTGGSGNAANLPDITDVGGNVGIGTTNPTNPLVVVGPSGTTQANIASFTNGTNGAYTSMTGVGQASVVPTWSNGSQVVEMVPSGTGNGIVSAFTGNLLFQTNLRNTQMAITSAGNVGIGTGSPTAKLEVNGDIKLTGTGGSAGTLTFGDGSVQSKAVATTANGGTAVAGLVFNNLYLNTNESAPHAYRIATLPDASSLGAYDHLHLFATLNPNWLAIGNSYVDVTFSNRSGFTYTYTLKGAAATPYARLVAYRNSNNTVDIYIQMNGQSTYTTATYSVIENQQATVYTNPTDVGGSIPGTIVFDSSDYAHYQPSTSIDNTGNFTLAGNVILTPNKGGSITFPDNTKQMTAWNGSAPGQDYADSVDVAGNRAEYEPGDVLVIDSDTDRTFRKAAEPYSRLVAGVYSTKPGFLGKRQAAGTSPSEAEVPLAMAGIVPTKVSAENGPIKRGDLLVASSTPGYAMKGTDAALLTGAVIGKALGTLASGHRVIEVLVSLQ